MLASTRDPLIITIVPNNVLTCSSSQQYHDILFLAGGKEGDKVAIVKPQNIESWFGQVRPYSDVYKAETRRIRALWKELQTPGFKWFQPEELAVYSRKQLRDARSHSSFSRAIAYARRSMLYNPLVFSRAFLKRGEWYTALGRLLRSRPVTEKDHKVNTQRIREVDWFGLHFWITFIFPAY